MHPQSITRPCTTGLLFVDPVLARALRSLPAAVLYAYVVYHGDGEPGAWCDYDPEHIAADLALTPTIVDAAARRLEDTGWTERDGAHIHSVPEATRARRVSPAPYKRQRFSRLAWREKLHAYGHACAYCGATDRRLEQEHVIPLEAGGPDTWDNIVPACHPCNHRKGTQTWTPRAPDA